MRKIYIKVVVLFLLGSALSYSQDFLSISSGTTHANYTPFRVNINLITDSEINCATQSLSINIGTLNFTANSILPADIYGGTVTYTQNETTGNLITISRINNTSNGGNSRELSFNLYFSKETCNGITSIINAKVLNDCNNGSVIQNGQITVTSNTESKGAVRSFYHKFGYSNTINYCLGSVVGYHINTQNINPVRYSGFTVRDASLQVTVPKCALLKWVYRANTYNATGIEYSVISSTATEKIYEIKNTNQDWNVIVPIDYNLVGASLTYDIFIEYPCEQNADPDCISGDNIVTAQLYGKTDCEDVTPYAVNDPISLTTILDTATTCPKYNQNCEGGTGGDAIVIAPIPNYTRCSTSCKNSIMMFQMRLPPSLSSAYTEPREFVVDLPDGMYLTEEASVNTACTENDTEIKYLDVNGNELSLNNIAATKTIKWVFNCVTSLPETFFRFIYKYSASETPTEGFVFNYRYRMVGSSTDIQSGTYSLNRNCAAPSFNLRKFVGKENITNYNLYSASGIPEEVFSYRIHIRNDGDTELLNTIIEDVLDDRLTYMGNLSYAFVTDANNYNGPYTSISGSNVTIPDFGSFTLTEPPIGTTPSSNSNRALRFSNFNFPCSDKTLSIQFDVKMNYNVISGNTIPNTLIVKNSDNHFTSNAPVIEIGSINSVTSELYARCIEDTTWHKDQVTGKDGQEIEFKMRLINNGTEPLEIEHLINQKPQIGDQFEFGSTARGSEFSINYDCTSIMKVIKNDQTSVSNVVYNYSNDMVGIDRTMLCSPVGTGSPTWSTSCSTSANWLSVVFPSGFTLNPTEYVDVYYKGTTSGTLGDAFNSFSYKIKDCSLLSTNSNTIKIVNDGEGCCQQIFADFNFLENQGGYICGSRWVTPYIKPYGFEDYNFQYKWSIKDPQGNVVLSSTLAKPERVLLTSTGQHLFELELIDPNGIDCKHLFGAHINVIECAPSCTVTNPFSQNVADALKNVVKYLVSQKNNRLTDEEINATINVNPKPQELLDLLPFIVEDGTNPLGIYNFKTGDNSNGLVFEISFSFSPDHLSPDVHIYGNVYNLISKSFEIDRSLYVDSDTYMIHPPFQGDENNIKIDNLEIRHLNFCPSAVPLCTDTNPYTPNVKKALANVIQYILQLKEKGISDTDINNNYSYNSPGILTPLSYYIKEDFPRLAHVNTTFLDGKVTELSFSFSLDHEIDVSIKGGNFTAATFTEANFDLQIPAISENEEDFIEIFNHTNGAFSINEIKIKHIDFCPGKICDNHIAIVLDESGSIDIYDKAQIKRQLVQFLERQTELNEKQGWSMYVSLIGMSDSDRNARWDHIEPRIISQYSLENIYEPWVEEYGNRYDKADNDGISPSSDYWKSGLDKALSLTPKPKLVIMITDGAQTASAADLKATMRRFSNYGDDATAPHLYIVGINEGHYVYGEPTAETVDPNTGTSSSLTVSLALSLKYLFNLNEFDTAQFPVNSYDNTNAVPNFSADDYIGLENFTDFGDPESAEFVNFISNHMDDVYIKCAADALIDPCLVCYSFQPEPGEWYALSAWVKEEQNVQVKEYSAPRIELRFLDLNKSLISSTKEMQSPHDNSKNVFSPRGDIIDGWQRIYGEFKVPLDPENPDGPNSTHYIEFELANTSGSVPVFFDDIRIYPTKGSVKSFVYDPETFRLMSELDENNYATFYEYDNEGGLVRIKKETAEGVKTIQETRSGNVLQTNN